MEQREEKRIVEYPRRDLSFKCSRRKFFRALFQEVIVFEGSLKGGQGFRLTELGSLPDDQLAQIKPIVNPDCEIFLEEGHIYSKSRKTGATLKLFPAEKENLAAFNLFDGRHDLGEIARRLAQEMGWDEERAFAHARNLFLFLVQHVVCVPKEPPRPARQDGAP